MWKQEPWNEHDIQRHPYLKASSVFHWVKDSAGTISLPFGDLRFAIDNGPVEIVSFPIKHGGSFHNHVICVPGG